jgi:hypothetical protein
MKYDFLNIREEQNNEIDQIIKQENIAGNESLLLKGGKGCGYESPQKVLFPPPRGTPW